METVFPYGSIDAHSNSLINIVSPKAVEVVSPSVYTIPIQEVKHSEEDLDDFPPEPLIYTPQKLAPISGHYDAIQPYLNDELLYERVDVEPI